MANRDADLEAYKQAFESLRHYGSLRFTLLTAYIVISGALFTLALPVKGWSLQFIFPFAAGLVIATAFGLTEWRINQILTFHANKINELGKLLEMSPEGAAIPPRSAIYWSTQVLMLIVYLGSIVMWLIAAWVV